MIVNNVPCSPATLRLLLQPLLVSKLGVQSR